MPGKVSKAITFLKKCTSVELKRKLRGNPLNWDVHFDESSIEFQELNKAARQNPEIKGKRVNPLNCPTAVKLVNKF